MGRADAQSCPSAVTTVEPASASPVTFVVKSSTKPY
jgi:hypothetical protein